MQAAPKQLAWAEVPVHILVELVGCLLLVNKLLVDKILMDRIGTN